MAQTCQEYRPGNQWRVAGVGSAVASKIGFKGKASGYVHKAGSYGLITWTRSGTGKEALVNGVY